MPTNIADNTPNVNPLPSHNFLDSILGMFGSAKSTYTAPPQTPTAPPVVNKANPVPADWQPHIKGSYDMYSGNTPGIVETTLGMESSMGTDTKNQKTDLGKFGWIGGHTTTGAWNNTMQQLKKNPDLDIKAIKSNIPGIKDLSTPQGAIYATASVLQQLKNENPNMSDADIYFKKYNTDPKVDTPVNRQKFNDLMSQYAKSSPQTNLASK